MMTMPIPRCYGLCRVHINWTRLNDGRSPVMFEFDKHCRRHRKFIHAIDIGLDPLGQGLIHDINDAVEHATWKIEFVSGVGLLTAGPHDETSFHVTGVSFDPDNSAFSKAHR